MAKNVLHIQWALIKLGILPLHGRDELGYLCVCECVSVDTCVLVYVNVSLITETEVVDNVLYKNSVL